MSLTIHSRTWKNWSDGQKHGSCKPQGHMNISAFSILKRVNWIDNFIQNWLGWYAIRLNYLTHDLDKHIVYGIENPLFILHFVWQRDQKNTYSTGQLQILLYLLGMSEMWKKTFFLLKSKMLFMISSLSNALIGPLLFIVFFITLYEKRPLSYQNQTCCLLLAASMLRKCTGTMHHNARKRTIQTPLGEDTADLYQI